ncbi:hypothetical protein [Streptomyces sp. NPDC059513]|uniref:hypothetical protein n=1 Tax=unclassified Streptomyces TaxID=2593676 RepID=UPI0036C9E522
MSWIEAALTRPFVQDLDEDIHPKLALSLLTSGEHWRFERASHRSDHLPPRRDSDGRFSEPSWALVFAYSLVIEPEHTEQGLNVLSEIVSSQEVAQDNEMAAVANAFAALGLSRLRYTQQAIKITESALRNSPPNSLARVFLLQQLTMHLTDANKYDDALRAARMARNTFRQWKTEARPSTPAQREIISGVSQAIESNILELKTVTSRTVKFPRTPYIKPNHYWAERNLVLQMGFSAQVRDSFDTEVRNALGRQGTRFSDRESPHAALTTYLVESELVGHYRRVLAARLSLGKQQASELDYTNEQRVKYCAHLIRQSRDSKTYENFLQILMASGPLSVLADEVTRAAEEISWPPRREHFTALKVAGPLLAKQTAQHALATLLEMRSGAHLRDLNSQYLADAQIWPAIRSLTAVAGEHSSVSRKMRDLATDASAHVFSELVTTARTIDWKKVGEPERRSWESWISEAKSEDASFLEQEISQALARLGDQEPLERYFSDPSGLTIPEVSTLVDYGSENREFRLPVAVVEEISQLLTKELSQLMHDASRGSFSFGVVDTVLLGGIFSKQYPEEGIWPEIRKVILHPQVTSSQKAGFLEWVIHNPEVIPNDFAQGFSDRDKSILLSQEEDWISEGTRESGFRFYCALKLLTEEEVIERVLQLITSSESRDRADVALTIRAATGIVSPDWSFDILEILARDASPSVRSLAGMVIGGVANSSRSISTRRINSTIRALLESEGVWVPLRTLHGLINDVFRGREIDTSGYKEVVSELATGHQNYFVREAARKLLESSTEGKSGVREE